jgi:hypothetical protein
MKFLSLFCLCAGAAALAGCSRPAVAAASTQTAAAAASTAPAIEPAGRTAQFTFPSQTLSVPEGFTVELVAGPPLVNRPISVAFDPQGRLYATWRRTL